MPRFKHPQNRHERKLIAKIKNNKNTGGHNMTTQVFQTAISKDLIAQLIAPFLNLPDNVDISTFHIEGVKKDMVPISYVLVEKTKLQQQGGDENSPDRP